MSQPPEWSAALNANRREDLEWMARWGETLAGAAHRLNLTPTALDKWCNRHAPELGRQLRAQERNIA